MQRHQAGFDADADHEDPEGADETRDALGDTRIGDAVWMASENPMDEAVVMAIGELIAIVAGGYVMARLFLNSGKAA